MTITESRNAAVAEIEEVIGDWAEALRRKDAARVLAHGTDDCLVFSLAPPLKASDADAGGPSSGSPRGKDRSASPLRISTFR